METKFLTFTSQECLDIIKSNEVLSFPTETVYGLGVIYDSKEAFDRLCKLKIEFLINHLQLWLVKRRNKSIC